MNWFEQPTSEYKDVIGKQILKGCGPAGYGAFIILKQVIAENMNEDAREWGLVPKDETMASLAEKCGMQEPQFREFIAFCDDRYFLEKKDGRLFCPSLLEQKNRYLKTVERRQLKKNTGVHTAHTVHTAHNAHTDTQWDVTNTTQAHTQTQNKLLTKVNKASPPQVKEKSLEYGNKHVDFLLGWFKENYGFPPTDKQPRRSAYNIIQIFQKHIRAKGNDPFEELPQYGDRTLKALGIYLDWVLHQRSLEGVKTLDILKRNIEVWLAGVQT